MPWGWALGAAENLLLLVSGGPHARLLRSCSYILKRTPESCAVLSVHSVSDH
jgi:hypothetical protein